VPPGTETNLTLAAHQPVGRRVATIPDTRRLGNQPALGRRTADEPDVRRAGDQTTLARRTAKEPTL
jgi:hypothetical protein